MRRVDSYLPASILIDMLYILRTARGNTEAKRAIERCVAAYPATSQNYGVPRTQPAPGVVWLVHIVAMTTDNEGHLWYVRAGASVIEEVQA